MKARFEDWMKGADANLNAKLSEIRADVAAQFKELKSKVANIARDSDDALAEFEEIKAHFERKEPNK